MAIVFADRVKVRSYSTGIAEFILESVVPGYQSFAAIGDGNQCYYGIEDQAGNWEVGLGTYDIDSTQQFLYRNTVISSSNSNNLVNFAAGGKSVYTTLPSSLAASIGAGVSNADTFSFSVAADDSTLQTISNNESIKFIGSGTVTTSSDAEGNITITGSGGGGSIPTVVTTGAVGINGAAHAKVQFTVASTLTVTAVGVTVIGVSVPANSRITLSGSPATGSFDIVAVATYTTPGDTYLFIPFATNSAGTGYGAPIAGAGTNPCYVRGTMITMADMSRVAVENITYNDNILVWDFDLGEFASAKPLWIKKTQTSVTSCLLKFSDRSELRIVGESPKAHRIFNKEAGKFTYGSMPETPIGTTTFNDQGEEITLISKEWIVGEVEFYNVMTDYHMNLFANSILTSMRYNNVYPITDMKFVKDDRTLRTANDYPNIEERLFRGFRLAEQTQSVEDIETHIQWLLALEVERETEVA
jgi:hypothetical protein